MIAVAKYWKLATIVVLVGALLLSCHERDQALIAKGRAEEQLKALTAKTHHDSIAGALADDVVRRDTVVLTQWVTKRDTLRLTLKLTDTIRVAQFIAVQDSTIHACRESVSALAVSCARKDTLLADLRAQLAVRVAAPPTASFSQRLLWGLGGLALGAVVDRALTH